jgi:hypothetical protein
MGVLRSIFEKVGLLREPQPLVEEGVERAYKHARNELLEDSMNVGAAVAMAGASVLTTVYAASQKFQGDSALVAASAFMTFVPIASALLGLSAKNRGTLVNKYNKAKLDLRIEQEKERVKEMLHALQPEVTLSFVKYEP